VKLAQFRADDLKRAIEIYLEEAWGATPCPRLPKLPDTEGLRVDALLPPKLPGIFRHEPARPPEKIVDEYTLQLGNQRYGLMKLVLGEHLIVGEYFLSVDTHDWMFKPDASDPDEQRAWEETLRYNAGLKERVERRWNEAKLPTLDYAPTASNRGPRGHAARPADPDRRRRPRRGRDAGRLPRLPRLRLRRRARRRRGAREGRREAPPARDHGRRHAAQDRPRGDRRAQGRPGPRRDPGPALVEAAAAAVGRQRGERPLRAAGEAAGRRQRVPGQAVSGRRLAVLRRVAPQAANGQLSRRVQVVAQRDNLARGVQVDAPGRPR
jgi:hypothetical protein